MHFEQREGVVSKLKYINSINSLNGTILSEIEKEKGMKKKKLKKKVLETCATPTNIPTCTY